MANTTDGTGRNNSTPQGASSLAIKGMFTPVLAKHTKNFGLQDSISIWIEARLKQVERLLPGDDLCGFPGGRKPRGWESRYLAVLLVRAVQAADPRAAVPVSGRDCRQDMSNLKPRQPRVRQGQEAYNNLHRQVLIRDSWRCQTCGAVENLHVHHMRSRRGLGDD